METARLRLRRFCVRRLCHTSSSRAGGVIPSAAMKKLLAVVAMLAGVAAAQGQAPSQAPNFTLKKIGEGVYAAISPDGSKAGSNAGFIVGDGGVVVVDSFIDPIPAQEMLREIRKISKLPVLYLVNTHYHLDHTGGNAVFADADARIVAQRNLRGWERTENLKFFGANPKPEQQARVEALVLPDLVYTEELDIYAGSRLVQVRYMRGHTGGDSVVLVPDANVVFGGDLIWRAHLPNLIDASTAPWLQTLEKLVADHPAATFVPGHGDVATAADVRDFHDYLAALRQAVAKGQAEGKSGQALVDAVSPMIQEKYGAWGFKGFVQRNIEQTAAELAGTKKIPVPAE